MEGTPLEPRAIALASPWPDGGWGGVWPAAVLLGASSAAALALGAWLASLAAAVPAPALAPWIAEHALWGAALGGLVTFALRLAASRNPALSDDALRRRIASRATPAGVGLGFALALLAWSPSPGAAAAPALGLAAGGATWLLATRHWKRGARELPRLDPARVAALVAVLTAPLALSEGAPLAAAWRSLLAP